MCSTKSLFLKQSSQHHKAVLRIEPCLDVAGSSTEYCTVKNVALEEIPLGAENKPEQTHPSRLGKTAFGIVLAIVHLLLEDAQCGVGKMNHRQRTWVRGHFVDCAVDLGDRMYCGRPVYLVATEEADVVIGITRLVLLVEKHIAQRHLKRSGWVGLRYGVVQIVAQLGCDYLVGIDHQHPWMRSGLDSGIARRLANIDVTLRECDYTATVGLGYGEGAVGAFHVAHHDLVKPLEGRQHAVEMLLGVVGVEYRRNLLLLVDIFHLMIFWANIATFANLSLFLRYHSP